MAHTFLDKIFGDPSQKMLKKAQPIVTAINGFEATIGALSDEALKAKTKEFKDRLTGGASLDELLPEAFAVARESAKRSLNMRHFDVQLIGGYVLFNNGIAEMKTGEGKTLVATLPLYLMALTGKGAHLVTVNDYLSRRDAGWMAPIFHALGLTCGVITHQTAYIYDPEYSDESHIDERLRHLRPCARKEAYAADITYGTNNEFGFDYLRDNMVQTLEQMVQRDLHFAIVDEVDSILIDEARTPLIISAPDFESSQKYAEFARLVQKLKENEDYNVDEKMRAATLSDIGIGKMEKLLGVENIYTDRGITEVHHIEQALKAHALFKKDRDYVVKDGEVVIVDEFTGRLMPGRRYSEGLHQAIEAKEGLTVQQESKTLATITFQNYFRLYEKLAGMTGTAKTEEEEFQKIYNLDVVVIPTNKQIAREDKADRIYKSETAKFNAVVEEVKNRHEKGQPVLIGTISIEKNEILSGLLTEAGLTHELLNAKQHEREAQILSDAGRPGAITVATNMAGRGVDIKLGGDGATKEQEDAVRVLGGLHVIGTERHESRRIDNQLRGRSGRQGDPGSTQFYVSLDDDLMRIFGSDRIRKVMETLKMPEDMPIENGLISRSLEAAQKKVEGFHFDSRKHVVQYDDVINRHRESIYKRRRDLLKSENHKDEIFGLIQEEVTAVVGFHTADEHEANWNIEEIYEVINTIFPVPAETRLKLDEIAEDAGSAIEDKTARGKLIGYLLKLATQEYNKLEAEVAKVTGATTAMRTVERGVLLRSIDTLWVEHLQAIDHLRAGIGLRAYGQRDPLIEYQREARRLYQDLQGFIRKQVVYTIFKISVSAQLAPGVMQQVARNITLNAPDKTGDSHSAILQAAQGGGTQAALQQQVANRESQSVAVDDSSHYQGQKVGRNDLCPCGSGKKFKKCHGK